MPQLTINKTYANGQILFEADLDEIKNAIEELINTTGLDASNIQPGAINADLLAADSVTADKFADGAVTSGKIATGAVTTDKIADGAVTSEKIEAGAVTNAKIPDAELTNVKAVLNLVTSDNIAFTATSTSETDTGIEATITTTGNPVIIWLIRTDAFGNPSRGHIRSTVSTDVDEVHNIRLKRDGSTIAYYSAQASIENNKTFQWPISTLFFYDAPSAGTYTYKITLQARSGYAIGGRMVIKEHK
jgi:hypothetical protein